MTMMKKGKRMLVFLLAMSMMLFSQLSVFAAEDMIQIRYKAIQKGDVVVYGDSYFYQETYDTVNEPQVPPSAVFTVTAPYKYDKASRARVMELTAANGVVKLVPIRDIAFISAATGAKDSDYENGQDPKPVKQVENVNTWKLTMKNYYDEDDNPKGMRELDITNVQKLGNCIVFDYADLYSNGHNYMSAMITTKNGNQVIAYDRIEDATKRGYGTAVINWPTEYEQNEYVLKIFAEKYNGDNMTDYVSKMQTVYRGLDKHWKPKVS